MEPEKKRMDEPIFSGKQTVVMGISIMISMLISLWTILVFQDQLTWVTVATIAVDISIIIINALLRATHTELIPDNSKYEILKKTVLNPLVDGLKRISLALHSANPDNEKMNLIEKAFVLFSYNWDLLNRGQELDDKFTEKIDRILEPFKKKE